MPKVRDPRKNPMKGPWFPSFEDAKPSTKSRRQWVRHTGRQQAIKNLRHSCVHVFKLTDEESIAARKRCITAVKDEPEPEYAQYHLMFAAWEAHEGTGTPWAQAMNHLLDKFDDTKADANTPHVQNALTSSPNEA